MSFIYIEYIASIIKKAKPINDVVALKKLFSKLDHLKNRIHIKEYFLLESLIEKKVENRDLSPLIHKWVRNAKRDVLEIIEKNKKIKLQKEQGKKSN